LEQSLPAIVTYRFSGVFALAMAAHLSQNLTIPLEHGFFYICRNHSPRRRLDVYLSTSNMLLIRGFLTEVIGNVSFKG
jgi:hypothetical protein